MLDEGALKQSLSDPRHQGFVGQQFARYDILSQISKGGVGVVFRAKHRELGQLVALKVLIRQDPSAEAIARFRREAKVLAQIKHPYVVGISDLGEENGVPYLAMELIEGKNLHQMVRGPGGELPDFDTVVEIMTHQAKALAACHEQGVIHRDVKPHNIIVEQSTGRSVLTDFGLVKRDPSVVGGSTDGGSQVSQAGALLGTPSFMSPEQFEPDGAFGKVEVRTDVWGLGATLYFLLTGKPPFQATNIVDLYHEVTTQPVVKPGALRGGIPEPLESLCVACLTKNVAERPTMAEVVHRLEALEGRSTRSQASRGLRHTAVLILLLVLAVGADIVWLHPERGKRVLRLFQPGPPPPPVPDDPTAPDALETPATPPPAPGGETFVDLSLRASKGQVDAMLRMGLMLKDGQGVQKDPTAARTWLARAAEAGDAQGMFWSGVCHARGIGGPIDDVEALAWFERGAAEAHPKSMFWLGTLLASGRGTKDGKADPSGARDWFVKARDLGDAEIKPKAIEALVKLRQAHPELAE